ncbi:unnamed protein product [Toxocara canis]|uniref:THAP-type domain-containing protein n=1 Tax=Toxocara canis TaxID=6265 RepID=A0A183UYN4_TOXCA|nr:unnamed protein product [Toxocara canis]
MRSELIDEDNPLWLMRRAKTEVCHGGILRTHPVMVVDEQLPDVCSIDRGDDDELYEEMDEEDDDDQNTRVGDSLKPSGQSQGVDARRGVIPIATQIQSRPRCTVCRRFQDGCVRLFRWPRDVKVRRKWCAFFGIDENEVALNLETSYICSWHFDPDQFLYSDQKVYWAPDVCPRHKIRRPANFEPFPWELASNTTTITNCTAGTENKLGQRRRPKLPPPKATDIFFRQSKYRIAGKTKHPVAVLRLPNDPLFCYEFSYNRTSQIDGTKFYACLQCRKAKAETRVKDYIRTIHLDGARLLSRGDPFAGHHFACKPIFDAPQHGDDDSYPRVPEERRDRSLYAAAPSVSKPRTCCSSMSCEPPPLSPMRPSSDHTTEDASVHITVRQRICGERPSYVQELKDEQFFFDRPRFPSNERQSKIGAASSDRLVEVFDRLMSTGKEGGGTMHVIDREIRSGSAYNCISQPHNQERSTPIARCYICFRVLRDAAQLVSHLKRHIREAPLCQHCAERCEPDAAFTSRALRICRRCTMRNSANESSVSIARLRKFESENPQGDISLRTDEPRSSLLAYEQGVNRWLNDQLIVVD